jgi:hypothetical protein
VKASDSNRPPSSATTQRENILRVLVNAQGGWVPSPQIAALAQQYNARLFELRRSGFAIENKTQTDEGTGERRSWFRLVRQSPTAPGDSLDPYMHRATGLPLFDAAVSK